MRDDNTARVGRGGGNELRRCGMLGVYKHDTNKLPFWAERSALILYFQKKKEEKNGNRRPGRPCGGRGVWGEEGGDK